MPYRLMDILTMVGLLLCKICFYDIIFNHFFHYFSLENAFGAINILIMNYISTDENPVPKKFLN